MDSYDLERRPVFASTARDFIEASIHADRDFLAAFDPHRDKDAFEREWRARQSGARSEVNAFEPHYEGSPIVLGPRGGVSSAIGSHKFIARAGHHLAPQPLSSGTNVFDALGDGFSLLAFGADDKSVSGFEAAAEKLGTPLKTIVDTRADGREKYEASLVLVRPDQFVAWASNDPPSDPAAILARAMGSA